jgi:hypothetical protein
MSKKLADVYSIYKGSNGNATCSLFDELRQHGSIGVLAVELFRAQKASERAKVYRGGVRGKGSYRGMAYDRKQWAMDNLCQALAQSKGLFGWGWGIDEKQEVHKHVLYVDLPTGQVSFHTGQRGEGPDYGKHWDGIPGQSPDRICRWIARVLTAQTEAAA